jgi:hypothetical protein
MMHERGRKAKDPTEELIEAHQCEWTATDLTADRGLIRLNHYFCPHITRVPETYSYPTK